MKFYLGIIIIQSYQLIFTHILNLIKYQTSYEFGYAEKIFFSMVFNKHLCTIIWQFRCQNYSIYSFTIKYEYNDNSYSPVDTQPI
jgi:hypothetical protein